MTAIPTGGLRVPTVILFVLAIIIVLAASAPDAAATVIYVNAAGGGLNNGTSWLDAYTDLQVALGAATSGDELWVVVGTYYPHATDRTVSFQLKDGVAVYGGFAGTEVSVIGRVGVGETTLSGNIGTPLSDLDNSYHVVDASGTNSTAILNVCTVTKGYATGPGTDASGGGIYCDGGSPTLISLNVYDNLAGGGAGIHCANGSNPTITFGTFHSNTAAGGAGGGMENVSGSSPLVQRVAFFGNTAGGSGGGISNDGASNPTMKGVLISGNSATFTGGGMYCYGSSPTLINAVVEGNTAGTYGGGILLSDLSHPTLVNVSIVDNTATTESGGAMAQSVGCTPQITNCILWGNSAGTSDDEIHIFLAGGSPVISYSIVAGGLPVGATDAGNNLNMDPLFRSSGGPRLSPGSPAIDAGNTAANSEPYDYWFRTRVVGTDIDMGAYEFACAAGAVVYVDIGAFTTEEGDSWSTAFRSLHDAIAHADYCGGVDEIWVADGTYRTSGLSPLDRTLTFTLHDGIAIYGGFDGTETMRSQRDWETNVTILTGEIGAAPNVTDNAYHVVSAGGVGPTAALDGVTIERGYADGGGGNSDGAGMYLTNASPTLANLIICDNEAIDNGGGMAVYGGGFPDVRDVRFDNNRANGGAGVYNDGSAPVFTNVAFVDNDASDAGGGITNRNASQPSFTNCIFLHNTSANGGGGVYNYQTFPQMVNVSFFGNDGGVIGGGILNIEYSTPTLVNAIMWGNTASFDGDEIYNDNMLGSPTSTSVSYSLIAGCGGSGGGWNPAIGTDGGGNIDADPRYVNPAGGDLMLLYDSPCINTGDNGFNAELYDIAGNARYVGPTIDMGAHEYPAPVSVGDRPAIVETAIRSTYPNPFNPTVSIEFTLRSAGRVELRVYDVRGALVATLVDGTMDAGAHVAHWNGRSDADQAQASGVYLVRMVSGGKTAVRKVVMLK